MKKNLKSIIKNISELREKAKAFIQELPEASSDVTLTSMNPRCGIVSLSTIAKNNFILSPHYYINASAKEAIIKLLETTKIEHLEKVINRIIKTGCLPKGSITQANIKLNPEFINELSKIWSE